MFSLRGAVVAACKGPVEAGVDTSARSMKLPSSFGLRLGVMGYGVQGSDFASVRPFRPVLLLVHVHIDYVLMLTSIGRAQCVQVCLEAYYFICRLLRYSRGLNVDLR